MLIKLTISTNHTTFYMRAVDVMTIHRHQENLLQTVITTTLMTQKGPTFYIVDESPEEVAAAVYNCLYQANSSLPQ